MRKSCDVILTTLHVKTQNFSQNLVEALFYMWWYKERRQELQWHLQTIKDTR